MPMFASRPARAARRATRTASRSPARFAGLEALEDRRLLSVSVVSVVNGGTTGGNGISLEPSVSADGRYVAFSSTASNLVTGDTNNVSDVFLRDTQTGQTILISANQGGTVGNGASDEPSISADGRFVSFRSAASDLVANDTNAATAVTDVFVRDVQAGTTRRVSADSSGPNFTGNANGFSAEPFTSADGQYVAFTSRATDMVTGVTDREDVPTTPGQTGNVTDVFLRDLNSGSPNNAIQMVSVNTTGTVSGNGRSFDATVSANGRFVAFRSEASDLVNGDTNGVRDIFVRDMTDDVTTRISVGAGGAQGNGNSDSPSISQDGRYVVFSSTASNLVGNDSNGAVADVFLHDRNTGTTTLISANQLRTGSGDKESFEPTISQEGRFVAFTSAATDLVAGDNNNSTDIFLYDIESGTLNLVSINQAGRPAQGNSRDAFVAPGGQFVAFSSEAIDLVGGDTNNASDAFLATAPDRNGDSTAPVASLVPSDQPTNATGATTLQFTVTYTDNGDLRLTSFGNGDVEITAPGSTTPVQGTIVGSPVGSGRTVKVTYSIPAPGGTVDAADNGAYTVAVRGGEVQDAAGNSAAAGSIGTVTVTAGAAGAGDGPDLVPTFVGTLPSAVGGARGGKAVITLSNTGNQAVNVRRMVVALFLSADPLFDPSDTQVITKTMNYRANPNARPKKVSFKFTWPNPSGPSTGYQLLAQADATGLVQERNESNNVVGSAVTVAPPFVDLTGTLGAVPTALAAGQRVRVPLSVLNGGNVPAKGTATYRVLLSADDAVSGNDLELASLPKRLALRHGTRPRNVPLAFAVPTGLAAGTYRMLVQINYTGAVGESNTTNNTAVSSGTVTLA